MRDHLVNRHLAVSIAYQESLLKIMQPLFQKSLVQFFSYNRFFKNQTWIGLYSDTTPVKGDLLAGRGPLFVDAEGIFLDEGVYVHKDLADILKAKIDNQEVEDFFLQEKNPAGKAVVHNGLLIIKKNPIYDESFYFSLKEATITDRVYFFNVLSDLKKFCWYFLQKAKTIVQAAEKKPIPYKIPKSQPCDFGSMFLNAEGFATIEVKKFCFPTKYGDVFMSEQELACLRLIAKGHSQLEMAEQLDLSPRTVESYVRNLKNKLVLETKKELVQAYQSFAVMDYQ